MTNIEVGKSAEGTKYTSPGFQPRVKIQVYFQRWALIFGSETLIGSQQDGDGYKKSS